MDWTHRPTWNARTRFAGVVFFAFMMASCGKNDSQTPPMLGMSFDQVEALCGPGKALGVQGQGRLISYDHVSGSSARVDYHDNTVVTVWYDLGADSIEDKRLQYYLQLNAQGHQWTLLDATAEKTWLSAHWIRDDGATANCGGKDGPFLGVLDPISSESGVLDAPPASAQSTQNGAKFGLRQNVAVYVTKFGKPFKRDFGFMQPASTTLLFDHKGGENELMISISFWHGVAHHVMVSRRDEGELTDEDIRYALGLFSGGEQWKSENPEASDVQQQWHQNGDIGAFVSEFRPHLKVLSITTDEFWHEHATVSQNRHPLTVSSSYFLV